MGPPLNTLNLRQHSYPSLYIYFVLAIHVDGNFVELPPQSHTGTPCIKYTVKYQPWHEANGN